MGSDLETRQVKQNLPLAGLVQTLVVANSDQLPAAVVGVRLHLNIDVDLIKTDISKLLSNQILVQWDLIVNLIMDLIFCPRILSNVWIRKYLFENFTVIFN